MRVALASGGGVGGSGAAVHRRAARNRAGAAAGLEIGEHGGIRVDARMRTSNPHIWAVGDAVEVRDAVTRRYARVVPLAGPANRQGRIAADVIMGRDSVFRGVQGTSVVGILDRSSPLPGRARRR